MNQSNDFFQEFFQLYEYLLHLLSFVIDRMSEKIKYLYQPNNPSLLRLINATILGAKNIINEQQCVVRWQEI